MAANNLSFSASIVKSINSDVGGVTDSNEVASIIQNKTNNIIRNVNKFFDHISHCITNKGSPETNIIDLSCGKTYNIPDNKMQELFALLEDARLDNCLMHYQEKQKEDSSGLMYDFDVYQMSPLKCIESYTYIKILRAIGNTLINTVNFAEHRKEKIIKFYAFVIERPRISQDDSHKLAKEKTIYKDGFHILIPEIRLARPVKKYIQDQIIAAKLFDSAFYNDAYVQTGTEAFDAMSRSVNVHFFGSSKVKKSPYLLGHTFEIILNFAAGIPECEVISAHIDDKIKKYNMTYELSLSFNFATIINGNKHEATWLEKKHYSHLPKLDGKIQEIGERVNSSMDDSNLKDIENSISILTMCDAEAALLKNLLSILDISYAEEYEKWRNVLFAIAHTSLDYKNLALWFSMRNMQRFDMAGFEKTWSDAANRRDHNNPLTKRSIFYWAESSNKAKYDELFQNSYKAFLEKNVYLYDGVIEQGIVAKVLKMMLDNKFVVDNDRADDKEFTYWYEFIVPGQKMGPGEIYKWRKQQDPTSLHIFIQERLSLVYMQILELAEQKLENAKNDIETKYFARVIRTFKGYMAKLSNSGFQAGVIKMATYHFRQFGFAAELDKYDNVIGVGNGILEVGKVPRLIRSFHEYKISKFTPIEYFPYDPNNEMIKIVEEAFNTTFPEPDAGEFWRMYFSQAIDPAEVDSFLGMIVGGGSNGKTFWAQTIKNVLGKQYAVKTPITLLTDMRESSGSANSAYATLEGKLWNYFSEPNGPESFNTGRLKEMFGGEDQTTRNLFKGQTSFQMTATSLIISNFDLSTDCTDHGFWRRIFYYNSKVKFCANPDPNNPFEKKDDPRFIKFFKKDPDFRRALLSCLVEWNRQFKEKYNGNLRNINAPTIARETEEFRNRQDTINRFISQMIIVAAPEDKESFINIDLLCLKYAEWYNIMIKKGTSQNIGMIKSKFENSRLQKLFTKDKSGNTVILGHRVKDSSADQLRQNEQYLRVYGSDGK